MRKTTGHPSSTEFRNDGFKRARYIIRLCMGTYSVHEYSEVIKFTKQYCCTYLYSASSCCSTCIPGSFRALLSEFVLPSPSISYNSLNNARNDPGMHMEQQEEIPYTGTIQVSTTILFCEFYYCRIFMDRVSSHTKSYNITRSFEAIITKLELG